jgi:hypothetical protein
MLGSRAGLEDSCGLLLVDEENVSGMWWSSQSFVSSSSTMISIDWCVTAWLVEEDLTIILLLVVMGRLAGGLATPDVLVTLDERSWL